MCSYVTSVECKRTHRDLIHKVTQTTNLILVIIFTLYIIQQRLIYCYSQTFLEFVNQNITDHPILRQQLGPVILTAILQIQLRLFVSFITYIF